jgi:hypothetical protein
MATGIEGTPVLTKRVDLPCEAAGLTAPPVPVHLKFIPSGDRWSLLTLVEAGQAPALARWLRTFGPTSMQSGSGVAPKLIRAEFTTLPEPWEALLGTIRVHHIDVLPDGTASLFVEGTLEQYASLLVLTQTADPKVRMRADESAIPIAAMTARQFEALSTAVALGYYDIPHRMNLRTLAKKLNVTVGSVAELLRRAEAAVLTRYVDARAGSRWDDHSVGPNGLHVAPPIEVASGRDGNNDPEGLRPKRTGAER